MSATEANAHNSVDVVADLRRREAYPASGAAERAAGNSS